MLKGYITGWWQRKTAVGDQSSTFIVDVGFDHRPTKGLGWKSRQLAEADCVMFDSLGIRIPTLDGGRHICSGFQVEERAAGEFVVFCEVPFAIKETLGEFTKR